MSDIIIINLQELFDKGKLNRGDKFETRGGSVVSFIARSNIAKGYPFVFEFEPGLLIYRVDGKYEGDYKLCDMDIIRRVPDKRVVWVNAYESDSQEAFAVLGHKGYASRQDALNNINTRRKYLGTFIGEIEVWDE